MNSNSPSQHHKKAKGTAKPKGGTNPSTTEKGAAPKNFEKNFQKGTDENKELTDDQLREMSVDEIGLENKKSKGTVDDKPLTEEQLRNLSVDEIIRKISKFEKQEIVDQLQELFVTRLRNEYYISEAIKHGVDTDQITVDKCVELLKASKDGLNQLGGLLRLFRGETTSSSESTVTVQHVDIEERLDMFSDRMNEN